MAAAPSRIWLVRHGETEWSRDGRHTGTSDIPLTPRGESDAAAIRRELAGVAPGLVLCSPLQRARETARLAGLVPDAVDADLVEWDYGAWEGQTTAQIRQHLGDPAWVVWDHPIPPGATPGEQLTDVRVRVDRVIERCLPVVASGRDCVLVAHGHVLRILSARWLGLDPVAGRLFALDPATISALGFEHEQQVIRCWNATDVDRRG
ncbi:MAG: histidine phosphatase family protein [Actinomycetota bacterium]|nr:histidine phosphatase family protein [Actinomycetota bacterium]